MKLKTQMLPRFDHPSLHPPHPHPTPNPLDSQGAQAWEAGPGCPLTLTHSHGYVSSQNSLLSSDLRKLLILSQTHPGHTLGMRFRCRSPLSQVSQPGGATFSEYFTPPPELPEQAEGPHVPSAQARNLQATLGTPSSPCLPYPARLQSLNSRYLNYNTH